MNYYLITGANRGLGFELTKQLIKRGDSVVACCRNPDQAVQLETLAVNTKADQLVFYKLEMTNEAEINGLPQFLNQKGIKVNVMILNAGMAAPSEQLGNIAQQQMLDVINTNTIGPMLMIQAMTEHLSASKGNAKIICISSDLGSVSQASSLVFGLSYGISKAALNMGVRKFSSDMASHGISINAIHPGWVATDMGGSNAPLTTTQSALALLKLIDSFEPAQSGLYMDYNGNAMAW